MTNEELIDQIQKGINPGDNMEQLYTQNKGFIFNVIKKYRYACQSGCDATPVIEMDELMHEAYFGLIRAARRFDPDQGNTFLTYAVHWINQAVKRFLENSGQVVRVPVHRQEKIYKYNQVTSHFLSNYNRLPSIQEYAWYVGTSVNGIELLEKFMFQGQIKSLDEIIPGGENENMTVADTVASDVDIENVVVEKVAQEQIKEELWDIVAQVLKDDKKIKIMKMRYINCMTMERIAEENKVSRAAIDQMINQSLKMIKRNSRTRRLIVEIGFWDEDKPINANLVKIWAESGRISALDKKELAYAKRMGWVKEDVIIEKP